MTKAHELHSAGPFGQPKHPNCRLRTRAGNFQVFLGLPVREERGRKAIWANLSLLVS